LAEPCLTLVRADALKQAVQHDVERPVSITLLLPIQWHHPAQRALHIDSHIGIGEQIVNSHWGQQRQSQQAPGLRYVDAFGSANISDRPKIALIEQALPVVRQNR